jgi:hypothetical protein
MRDVLKPQVESPKWKIIILKIWNLYIETLDNIHMGKKDQTSLIDNDHNKSSIFPNTML